MREETPAAAAADSEGATRVQEGRRYHNRDRVVIRELTKDAVFKAGEPLETKGVKNVSEPVAELEEEDRTSEAKRSEAENGSVGVDPPGGGDERWDGDGGSDPDRSGKSDEFCFAADFPREVSGEAVGDECGREVLGVRYK